MRLPNLAVATVLALLVAPSCDKNVQPCDEYAKFADAVAPTCPSLSWDCETEYPLLEPERQQDLDWCLDCVRAQAEGETDRDCSSAPLSELDCGVLLEEILTPDASCFTSDASFLE